MSLETVLSIALGVGLAAACGFRVFVPLLFAAIAARTGHLDLSPGFAWLAGAGVRAAGAGGDGMAVRAGRPLASTHRALILRCAQGIIELGQNQRFSAASGCQPRRPRRG